MNGKENMNTYFFRSVLAIIIFLLTHQSFVPIKLCLAVITHSAHICKLELNPWHLLLIIIIYLPTSILTHSSFVTITAETTRIHLSALEACGVKSTIYLASIVSSSLLSALIPLMYSSIYPWMYSAPPRSLHVLAKMLANTSFNSLSCVTIYLQLSLCLHHLPFTKEFNGF